MHYILGYMLTRERWVLFVLFISLLFNGLAVVGRARATATIHPDHAAQVKEMAAAFTDCQRENLELRKKANDSH